MLGREEPNCPVNSCLGNVLLQLAWVGGGQNQGDLMPAPCVRLLLRLSPGKSYTVDEGRVCGDLINSRNPQVMLRQGLSPGKSSMGNKERGPTRFIN